MDGSAALLPAARVPWLSAMLIVALAGAPASASPTLIGDYVLTTGSFTNAVTGTQALGSLSVIPSTGTTGFVTGTASDAGWFWSGASGQGTGLSLSGLPLNDGGGFGKYSIGMRFSFSAVSEFRRMIAFADVDPGMYVTSGTFNFYSGANNTGGSITPDTFVDFVLTRNGTGVTGYVNGSSTPVLSLVNDSAVGRSPGGTLQFFRDNTGGVEFSPAGRISLLRIWDGPLTAAQIPTAMVPEPSALVLGGLGAAAILVGAWRRRRIRGR
jgi:hypothetical protein